MKLKLRDFIIVGSVLFLGFLAYSNFQNRPQKWQATNCYKNIQYQLTKDGKKGKRNRWKLQFKNNYNRLITFNYGVTEDENGYLTSQRKTLQAHETCEPVEIYTDKKEFYVLVDRLSFQVNGQPTEPCDAE